MNNKSQLFRFDEILAEKAEYVPGLHMSRHKDTFSKISILLDGGFSEQTDDSFVTIQSSGFIVKPNSVFHENVFGKKGATILSIIFLNEQVQPSFLNKWEVVLHPNLGMLGIKLWSAIKQSKNDKDIQQVVATIQSEVEFHQKTNKTPHLKMNEAEKLLFDLKQTTKKVEDIAHELSFHRVYFSRAFKKYYNTAPSNYARQSRLLKSIALLLHSKSSLASVAYDAGFSDQSHFTRHLKKEIGCTPQQLRQLFKM
jgi:AraC-like DNA-binding protein